MVENIGLAKWMNIKYVHKNVDYICGVVFVCFWVTLCVSYVLQPLPHEQDK
jgi:hypothetical protein